jgi:diaminobutyrate-2-oxoglutarate transaminase
MDFSALSFADAPLVRLTPPGPRSAEYLKYQSLHEGSAVSYPKGMPMALYRAKGATVEDVDGNIYIDFFAGAGVMAVGHSNPQVVEAIKEQAGELCHVLDFPNPSRRRLMEALLPLLPKGLDRVFFGGPTGSDAVESAVKLAKYNTKRYPLIAFHGSYHGMTSGALALTSGRAYKEDFLPRIPEIHFIPYAYCYRCAFGREAGKCDLECARYLDYVLTDSHSGVGMPAAVIVEAIQGEGGSIVPPDGWFPTIREICTRHGVLLIDDEIQAGVARTGKMFACGHTNTVPDIMTMSKALGGVGLPISAIAYKEELNTLPKGKHIGTFRSNALSCAAGAAALEFMVANKLAEHSLNLGGLMLRLLKELEKDSEVVGECRGKGLMLGVEFVKDKATKEPAPEVAAAVRTLCHRRGLLIEIGGHYFNVARFLPPLVLTEDLARKGIEVFAEAVREAEKSR